jgi:secreted trypsin-like serine protease
VGANTRTNGHEVKVKCAKSHPNYVWPSYQYDIAVLKLEEKITEITPAIMNQNTSYPDIAGTNLSVVGMGRNQTKGQVPDHLMKLQYSYVTDLDCKKTYGDKVSQGLHVCAYKIRAGGCFGDGGGGLYDDDMILIGALTGAAEGCAVTKAEDIYADVAAFYDWIQSQMTDDTCDRECVGCFCEAYSWASLTASRLVSSIGNFLS